MMFKQSHIINVYTCTHTYVVIGNVGINFRRHLIVLGKPYCESHYYAKKI